MNTRLVVAIRQGFKQIARNLAMAVASLVSISAIMLILGFFLIVLVNVNFMAEGVKDNFDTIQVNLLEETTREQADVMLADLNSSPDVKTAVFSSKEENLEHWKVKWGDHADVFDRLPANPLPNSIMITLSDVEKGPAVIDIINTFDGVKSITYSQDTADKLINIIEVIQIIALVLIGFLLIISVVVVSNTVKLTVLAREKEITIMKYVGATNWFIRGPFLMEGMLIGIISAVVSGSIVAAVYHYIVAKYGISLMLFMSSGLVSEKMLLGNLFIIFVAIGISVGACGSVISIRRFLDT
jgi:cell division transport system permease protein